MSIKLKTVFDYLKKYNLTKEKLDNLSIESNLNIPLTKDIKSFDKSETINELKRVVIQYLSIKNLGDKEYDYRIKSISSIIRKYDKYLIENRNFRKVFNDILGFRIICRSYDEILKLDKSKLRIVDMSKGKDIDDGYRGIHIYYQKNTKCYPIEIQIFTKKDKESNMFLHEFIYKHNVDPSIGKLLKKLIDNGKIKTNSDKMEAMKYVLHSHKKI